MRKIGNFISASDTGEWISVCCEMLSIRIKETLAQQTQFYLAISGGNTPKVIFEQLIKSNYLSNDEWQKVQFFWVDERLVPTDSPESNFGNAMLFLKQLPAKFHSMYDAALGEDASLERYRSALQVIPQSNGFPLFDLILLGMGEDGHTASLFPQSAGLDETKEAVFINEITSLKSRRMTLSFPVLLQAKESFILLNGVKKISIMQEMIAGEQAYPIENLFRGNNPKHWIYCK